MRRVPVLNKIGSPDPINFVLRQKLDLSLYNIHYTCYMPVPLWERADEIVGSEEDGSPHSREPQPLRPSRVRPRGHRKSKEKELHVAVGGGNMCDKGEDIAIKQIVENSAECSALCGCWCWPKCSGEMSQRVMTRRFESFDNFCVRKRRLESLTKDSNLLKDESFSSILLQTHKFGQKVPSFFAFLQYIFCCAGDGSTFWLKTCVFLTS
jgi:hypothetical protein